jgi:hypothetical protein
MKAMVLSSLKRKSLIHLIIISTGAGLSQPLLAQQYYKWVDRKGTTHYTTTPPPKTAKKKGKVETYGWHNSAPLNTNQPNTQDSQAVALPQNMQTPQGNSVPSSNSQQNAQTQTIPVLPATAPQTLATPSENVNQQPR